MGDRCYLEAWFREEDLPKVEELGIFDKDDYQGTEKGIAHFIDEQANYGHYDELRGLANDEVPFTGYHGDGGEYNGTEFVSDGETGYQEILTDRSGNWVVPVDEDGEPNSESVADAKRFIKTRAEVRKKFGLDE